MDARTLKTLTVSASIALTLAVVAYVGGLVAALAAAPEGFSMPDPQAVIGLGVIRLVLGLYSAHRNVEEG